MKKLYSLLLELFHQLKNNSQFLKPMQIEAYGMKIIGQGHMIDGYSNLNHASFYNSLKEEVDFIKKFKKKDDITIVDAGANLGFYSIVYSMMENVNVLSFEPFPETYEYLKKNITINKISNVKAIEMGLYSESKEMAIGSPNAFKLYSFFTKLFKFTDKDQAGCASVFTSEKSAPIAKFIKGDDCEELISLKQIDLIKIDVEGSELSVLKGLRNTILNQQPTLIVEFSLYALSAANVAPAELWNYLCDLGYTKYTVCEGDYSSDTWKPMEQAPEFKGAEDYFFTF